MSGACRIRTHLPLRRAPRPSRRTSRKDKRGAAATCAVSSKPDVIPIQPVPATTDGAADADAAGQGVSLYAKQKRFYIFGLVLYPQDFIYLTALLVLSALGLFLFTAVAGRLW